VVWEPVLLTDWASPTTGVLARLRHPEAVQYWDRRRLVSRSILETTRAQADHELNKCCQVTDPVWDLVAIYPAGVKWEASFPSPVFGGAPVVRVMGEFRRQLAAAEKR